MTHWLPMASLLALCACHPPDDTATTADASIATDSNPDAPPWPPPGTVAMFVASGTQGRNVISCDDGVTWTEHDVEITTSGEFNETGFAFGHGVFLKLMGWGGVCSFLRSENGVDWQRLTMTDVGLLSYMSECAGITFNGDGFTMVHAAGETFASNHEGSVFQQIGFVDNGEYVREIAGDGPSPGIVLAGGANDPSGVMKNPPHVSVDGGKTWSPTPGCSTLHAVSIGQEGGGAYGGGRMVYVGYKGEVCTSSDMTSWQETQLPGVEYLQGKVTFDGSLFWAADNTRVFVSPDGLTWTVRPLPSGVHLHEVARSKTGTYVGFDRGSSTFYRSADGIAWEMATTSPPAGPDLYRLIYGYGKPSPTCPL